MSELDREAQDILDAARGADQPRPGDKARIRAMVMAGVAASAANSAAAQTAAKGATTKAGMTVGLKAGLVSVSAVAVISAAVALQSFSKDSFSRDSVSPELKTKVQVTREPKAEPSSKDSSLSAHPTAVPPPTPPVESLVERSPKRPSSESLGPTSARARAPAAQRPHAASRASASRFKPKPKAPKPAENKAVALLEETRLLKAAQRALRRQDPKAALSAIEAHTRRFPNGSLIEERLAAKTRAHCALGEAEAAQKSLDALLELAPSSSYLKGVKSSCKTVLP